MEDFLAFYNRKKILITGHTGFMGSWLTKWLTMLGADVCGYALDPPTQPNLYETTNLSSKILDVRGDIRNAIMLRSAITEFQPQIVIHLAAQPIVLESYDDPVSTFDINVNGTVNLLNEIRKIKSVVEVIVVTSDKSYRNNEWVYPYRENDTLGGKDPYSASKSCQELVVDSFRKSYFADMSVNISTVRAGNVLGGGDWAKHRIIPDLVRGIISNQVTKIRNPESVRPWQHVLEPISGILTLSEKMWNDARYFGPWNFGPDYKSHITVSDLADKFINYYGAGKYEVVRNSSHMESEYLNLDISKVKNKLAWTPHYDLDKTVKVTAEWYQNYLEDAETIDHVTKKQIAEYASLERRDQVYHQHEGYRS